MQEQSRQISTFTLRQAEQRTFLNLAHQNNVIARPQSLMNNQSIIRNQRKLVHQQKTYRHRYSNIRQGIDSYLDSVQNIYSSPKQQNTSHIQHSHTKTQNIPRLDNELAMNYIQLVFKDYNIKNRFLRISDFERKINQSQTTLNGSPNQHYRGNAISINNGLSQKIKRFLSVTQSSKISKNVKNVSEQNAQTKNEKHSSTYQSPVTHKRNNTFQTSVNRSEYRYKIRQIFKYCINCEQLVLQAKIDYHVEFQCPELQSIYKLTFSQLGDLIKQKIRKIKKNLTQKLMVLRSKEDSLTQNNQDLICVMQNYALSQGNSQDKHEIYKNFQEKSQSQLKESMEMTKKLRYFQNIQNKLKQAEGNHGQKTVSYFIKHCQVQQNITPITHYHHLHSRKANQSF